jgi:hypothetical protein
MKKRQADLRNSSGSFKFRGIKNGSAAARRENSKATTHVVLFKKGGRGWAGHQMESSTLRVFQVKVQTDAGTTNKYCRYTEHETPVK